MRHLFEDWAKIKKNLISRYIMLFLDYDGTLTSIAETPDKAVLPQETKSILLDLAKDPKVKIAIISGRSLKDIKNIVGIRDIIYVGNHGLEIESPKIKFESQVSPRLKSVIKQIKNDLEGRLSEIKGVFIEDKGLTLSVHYRLLNKENLPLFENIIAEVTKPYVSCDKIKIYQGKKAYEIRPPALWDKGRVALWLFARQQFVKGEDRVLPIYIGDDVTDEDAFRALRKYLPAGRQEGITIFVGEAKKSDAQYYLKDTSEVRDFLKRIADLSIKNK